MERKVETDDAYWTSAHTGFDFDSADWQGPSGVSKLSTVLRKEGLVNGLDLLKCDDLTEAAEKSKSKKELSPDVTTLAYEEYSSRFDGKENPLIFIQKKEIPNILIRDGPTETVKNMVLGLNYSLAKYKAKSEKIELLDAAVKSHDGNAILEVVIFLRDTLKKSLFQREIVNYPDAVNVYLAYLEEDHETEELANMLLLLNRQNDAAIRKYEAAVLIENSESKLKRIENCLSIHFQLGATDAFLQNTVEEHKQILEEQIKFEKCNQIEPSNEILLCYEKLTRNKSLVGSSLLCSLIFSCLNHYNSGQLNIASPEKIKTAYKLSKKQFTWAALRALASLKKWPSIDDLFMSKNWLGTTKVRSCIAYGRILEVLHKEEAPNEIMKKFVALIENEEERLKLAGKYGCHSIIIENFKNNKDRVGLVKYTNSLIPNSVDFFLATEILKNQGIRWKN